MQKPFWHKLAPLVLAGALALSGCGGAKKTEATQSPASAEVQPAKPDLVIPKSFENAAAKQNFAINAVKDHYFKEANPLLEEAVKESPTAAGYAALGTTRYQLSNYTGAVEAWTKAAELDPTLAGEMNNNIGNALRDSKQVAEAEAAYRKALDIDPKRWTAATNLASLLQGQGKVDEAAKVLEQALTVNQDVPPLKQMLDAIKKG